MSVPGQAPGPTGASGGPSAQHPSPRRPPWGNTGTRVSNVHDPADPGEGAGSSEATSRPHGTGSAIAIAVLTGLLVGSVATVMHANIWYVNESLWLPWGLLFSGALLWLACVWCGTTTRRVWAAAVPGLITYVLSWAFAYLQSGSALVVTSWQAPIGIVGLGWFVTVFVAVMTAVVVTGRHLAGLRRKARAESAG